MKLNCDLGEGLDRIDEAIMPFIDWANVACGGHAGDLTTMGTTVQLAKEHRISVGAHPSYPDKQHFGRKSISIDPQKLYESLLKQINDLIGVCNVKKMPLAYIKPHGALYNDLVSNPALFELMTEIASTFRLPLMCFASEAVSTLVKQKNAPPGFIFEAFADRAYTDSGMLVSRSEKNSVYSDPSECVIQAKYLAEQQAVISITGKRISVNAETICVHGDSKCALEIAKAVRQAVAPTST